MARSASVGPFARAAIAAPLVGLFALAGCSGSGGSTAGVTPTTTTHPELIAVEYGRLVDVYGLQITSEGAVRTLYQSDVLIGSDIQDERGTNENKRDDEILYDFFGTDPDTLQPRLLIPRDMTGSAFTAAFEALDDQVRTVAPMRYGSNNGGLPFGVVPRNAALRLRLTSPDRGVDRRRGPRAPRRSR